MSDTAPVQDISRKKGFKKSLSGLFSRKKSGSLGDLSTASQTSRGRAAEPDNEEYAPTGEEYNPHGRRSKSSPRALEHKKSSASIATQGSNDAVADVTDQGSDVPKSSPRHAAASAKSAGASDQGDAPDESPVAHPKLDKAPGAAAAAAAAAEDGAVVAAGHGKEGPEARVVELERGSVESPHASSEAHVGVSGSSVQGSMGRGSGTLIPSKPVSPEIEAAEDQPMEPLAQRQSDDSGTPRDLSDSHAHLPAADSAAAAAGVAASATSGDDAASAAADSVAAGSSSAAGGAASASAERAGSEADSARYAAQGTDAPEGSEYVTEEGEEGGQDKAERDGKAKSPKGFMGLLKRAQSGASKVFLGIPTEKEVAEMQAAAAAKAAADAEAAEAAAAAAEKVKEPEVEPPIRKFPRGFMWGTGTSAYQVEGAYLDEGKGLSIWDAFSKSSGKISNNAVADVSCCHYYRYKEDVALMKEMGVKYYKLSLSWSRLIPTGRGKVNERGVAFYNRLINELLAHKIMPVVVLYHWDLPLTLQMEEDGWLNPKIVDHFVKYAKLCFSRFGDRVRYWITINEPWTAAVLGHDSGGQHAPGRMQDPSREVYRVGHHMLMAHARAYQVYQKLYRRKHKGKVGISLNADWYEAKPSSDAAESKRNVKAAERAMEFTLGWFARPLYQGDYPTLMRERCGNRLPRFTPEQSAMVKGSADFFALNHYSSHLCEQPSWYKELAPPEESEEDRMNKLAKLGAQLEKLLPKVFLVPEDEIQEGEVATEAQPDPAKVQLVPEDTEIPEDPYIESTGYWQDISVDQSDDDVWKTTDMGWGVCPEGIRKSINYIQKEFNPKGGIIITENGCAVAEEEVEDALRDIERAVYLKAYLREVHKAILHDDADVRGYFVWSLLDNFEWGYGYGKKFGLHYVDMQTLERIPKMSANWYAEVCKKNRLEMA